MNGYIFREAEFLAASRETSKSYYRLCDESVKLFQFMVNKGCYIFSMDETSREFENYYIKFDNRLDTVLRSLEDLLTILNRLFEQNKEIDNIFSRSISNFL